MDAVSPLTGAAPSLLRLESFLSEIESPLSAAQALAQAITNWIADERARVASGRAPAAAGGRAVGGYRWKCLFLPDGSDLLMSYKGMDYLARVRDGAIVYQGERLTPRQFTLAVAGDGRNAWRDLCVRQPGEKLWTRARTLRRRIEQQEACAPVSPLDAMREAAACMSDTLKSALALVEHANRSACMQDERRKGKARRAADVLADTCKFD
jgi:hypothetical protein